MVGYSELDQEAEANPDSGLFQRRTFFLLPHDRPNDPQGPYNEGAPGEAVDPRTVEPRCVGEDTPFAGRKLTRSSRLSRGSSRRPLNEYDPFHIERCVLALSADLVGRRRARGTRSWSGCTGLRRGSRAPR